MKQYTVWGHLEVQPWCHETIHCIRTFESTALLPWNNTLYNDIWKYSLAAMKQYTVQGHLKVKIPDLGRKCIRTFESIALPPWNTTLYYFVDYLFIFIVYCIIYIASQCNLCYVFLLLGQKNYHYRYKDIWKYSVAPMRQYTVLCTPTFTLHEGIVDQDSTKSLGCLRFLNAWSCVSCFI